MADRNNSEKYLMEKADMAIAELVYDKTHLVKAYNYYSGIRDNNQFKHLEQNYGIGNPTNITFTPLIRKHIDALVGEYLTLPINPGVSCKDSRTLTNMMREKQLYIYSEIQKTLQPKLNSALYSALNGDGKNQVSDAQIAKEISDIKDFSENNFVSNYEMAAQNIIQYFIQSRQVDLKNKLWQLLLDLFISGEAYYDELPTPNKQGIELKVLNPINCFPDINVNSRYINDSYRFVYREYLSKQEILAKYGTELSREDIKYLEDHDRLDYRNSSDLVFITSANQRFGLMETLQEGLQSGWGVTVQNRMGPSIPTDLYCVYQIQWIDTEKQKDGTYKQFRYKVTKIGSEIYILWGKDELAPRSVTTPTEVKLSVNGIQYTQRTGRPYSLMLATADLQDLYDYYQFMKSTIIAQSGTTGDWVDIAFIPTQLGTNVTERLQKWLAYKKSGMALLDSSQEGTPMTNTTFNGFDDTVKLQAIQAVDLAIQDIENTAMNMTGVFRERIGGIQQRDAVANVEVGLQQSFIITKQYNQCMDHILKEILLDMLNLAKVVYKNGMQGTLILGNQKTIFTALPEYYTMTDFDIHIKDSQEAIKEKQQLQQISQTIAGSGVLDPEVLLAVTTSNSITDMKVSMAKNMKRKREENNQIQQLTDQLQQATQQIQQMQQQLEQAQKQLQQYDEQEMQLRKAEIDNNYQVQMQKLKIQQKIAADKLVYDKKRVELEALQLFDTNSNNDEVKDY